MNAAGMPPWRIFRPFLAVGVVVALMVAAISFYISPKCLRELRMWITSVRADVITNGIQPGRFFVLEGKLTMHIRERLPNGQLAGILIDDQRNPKEQISILSEHGDILTNDNGTYLVLQMAPSSVSRPDNAIRPSCNSINMPLIYRGFLAARRKSPFPCRNASRGSCSTHQPMIRFIRWQAGGFLAEFHNRVTAPLYPLAFLFVTFAYLGAPRTTRQSRAMSLVGALVVISILRSARIRRCRLRRQQAVGPGHSLCRDRRGDRSWGVGNRARRHHRATCLRHPRGRCADRRRDPTGRQDYGESGMIGTTLSRYFGMRFLGAVVAIFAGALVLVAMVDFIEMLRRSSDVKDVSTLFVAQITLYRLPYLTERLMPFSVLVGAMSCYLNLSRRLELVIARAAGVSAWQFIAPAIVIAMLIGVASDDDLQPCFRRRCGRNRHGWRRSCSAATRTAFMILAADFWIRQRSEDGQSIMNAQSSSQQGLQLERRDRVSAR